MRKFFIDNLRWICVLLVVPYHVFLCFNDYHYVYYVYSTPVKFFSTFNLLCDLWFMPLLFFRFRHQHGVRPSKKNASPIRARAHNEAVDSIFSGVLLLVPILAYYARRYYDGYSGGLLDQYVHFFANWGVGSKGVSPYELGQMWFLLYLFVISMAGLPCITLGREPCRRVRMANWPLWAVVLLWVPLWGVWASRPAARRARDGKFRAFSARRPLFRKRPASGEAGSQRWALFALFATLLVSPGGDGPGLPPPWWSSPLEALIMWTGVLSLMGIGRRFLNFSNPATAISRLPPSRVPLPPILAGGDRVWRHTHDRPSLAPGPGDHGHLFGAQLRNV
jgi:hypothetical protein